MISLKRIATSILLAGWAIAALASAGLAQVSPEGPPRTPWVDASSSRTQWEQRSTKGWQARQTAAQKRSTLSEAPPWPTVAQRSMPPTSSGGPAAAPQQPATGGAPAVQGPDAAYQNIELIPPGTPEVTQSPGAYPAPSGVPYPGAMNGPGYPAGNCVSGSCFDGGGAVCGACGTACGGTCGWGPGAYWGPPPFQWIRNVSVFGGVHGFKGPVDFGLNGNFGIHEGADWGGPLGDPWGTGMQVGFEATHSNFQGHEVVGDGNARFDNGDRDQLFFTAGLFRRALYGGFQGGISFDYLHDAYYYTADLKQVRVEFSAVWPGWREIGFWGAFGVGDDRVVVPNVNAFTLQPLDQFNFFYRQYFRNGGEGRLWVGFTGQNDFLFGGDLWIPLGTHWAVENNFTFMVPNEAGQAGQREESWGLNVQLVWYPGCSARASRNNAFRPLLRVADNSVFMVHRQ